MKINFTILALILILGIGVTYFLDNQTQKQSDYNQIENFDIELLSGEKSSLSQIAKNKDIIIHFWATWCTPCLIEFPDLMAMAKENNPNIRVLAIAVQDEQEKINRFFKKNTIHIPENVEIAIDSDWSIAKAIFNTQKLPESFYLNQDRQTIARHNGAVKNWRTFPWITDYIIKTSE